MKPVRAAKPAGMIATSRVGPGMGPGQKGVKFEIGAEEEEGFVVMAPQKPSMKPAIGIGRQTRESDVRAGQCFKTAC